MTYIEKFLEERIQKAKEWASRIVAGECNDNEDLEMVLRLYLARHYNKPLFDQYFEQRTLDELVFESEVIRLISLPKTEKTSEIVNANKEEASALFDDWDEVDTSSWNDETFMNEAKEFMESGNFKDFNKGDKNGT